MDDDLDSGDMAANPFLMQSEPEPSTDNPFGAGMCQLCSKTFDFIFPSAWNLAICFKNI